MLTPLCVRSQVQLTADSREQLLFLQSQVAPVIDTYYITACCLHRLVGQELAEQDFVLDVLYEIKNKLMLGMLAYGEYQPPPRADG